MGASRRYAAEMIASGNKGLKTRCTHYIGHIYTHMYINTYTYEYTYAHAHTHTHIHTT